jgi:signal transduction histidine kinase
MSQRDGLSHDAIATYAHEFRGVLTIVAGYADLLRRDDVTAEERTAALDGIERAIARADSLCADALAGRAAPAHDDASLAPLTLARLAEQVVADQRLATGRRIELAVSAPAPVLGDAHALTRVLGNLIDNAAKYSLGNSAVEVRVAEATSGGELLSVVEVADRGPGIPADEVERLLRPFERLERDAGRPGTGLGLSIANDVAASHGGRLVIAARDGGGAIVRLELPRVETP